MATETFSLTPEFVYEISPTFSTIKTGFESGGVQLRARYAKARRQWRLVWNNATPDEAEELQAFHREMRGAAYDFYYAPADKVPRPYAAPTMGQTDGGTEDLGVRTRYAKFTWSDSSDNETEPSINYGTLSVEAGKVLTVTVPDFPQNVDKAWVYVGATAASYNKQATAITTSGGTWTEPESGYDSGGASVPTSNSLAETVTVHFMDDRIDVKKLSAVHYSMAVTLEELF